MLDKVYPISITSKFVPYGHDGSKCKKLTDYRHQVMGNLT
jgi:hypothetical protein